MTKKLYIFCCFLCVLLLFFSCGRSRNRNAAIKANSRTNSIQKSTRERRNSDNGKLIVKMQNRDGVYFVPCKINGVEMSFIFDTGASDIVISQTEAAFLLKQGKLSVDDFTGFQQYQIADGSIHEGMLVNLHSVQIGNRTLYNIQASIIGNTQAPLLLGQSALSEFGRVSIDYNRNEIIFE